MLKRATARMALTGTLKCGFMRERLGREEDESLVFP